LKLWTKFDIQFVTQKTSYNKSQQYALYTSYVDCLLADSQHD